MRLRLGDLTAGKEQMQWQGVWRLVSLELPPTSFTLPVLIGYSKVS